MATIYISPGRIARMLFGVLSALLAAALLVAFLRYGLGHDHGFGLLPAAERLFSLTREGNPATWFSSAALLLCAALLAAIGLARRTSGDRHGRHWTVLALLFVYVSLDETAMLHERTIVPLRAALGASGVFHFAWVVPAGALLLALGVAYLDFLRALPRRTRALFLAAAALYVGGALGLELVEGVYAERIGSAYRASGTRVLLTHVEEALEMAGTVTFAYALLAYLHAHVGVVQLSFGPGPVRLAADARRRETPAAVA